MWVSELSDGVRKLNGSTEVHREPFLCLCSKIWPKFVRNVGKSPYNFNSVFSTRCKMTTYTSLVIKLLIKMYTRSSATAEGSRDAL